MNKVIDQLFAIKRDYYEGMDFDCLCERVVDVAAIIADLDEYDAAQQACRTFALLLWGATSGTAVNPNTIKQALDGPERVTYLRAWVNMVSVIPTFKLAA